LVWGKKVTKRGNTWLRNAQKGRNRGKHHTIVKGHFVRLRKVNRKIGKA